ncbi:MAG: C45 family autoproteolytic acyltransferase/hydrolase [Anaerolineales bacterium]
MIKRIDLAGNHYTMGLQHGYQVRRLRPQISSAIKNRLLLLAKLDRDFETRIENLSLLWEEIARPTLEMMRGMAKNLSFEWDTFLRYTVGSYLVDRALQSRLSDGCTVWAAISPVTSDGTTMLIKNRDYRPWHKGIQCLVRAKPARGYQYTYLTSAGSPGVYSSGINEAGLVVADTHVASLDIGKGVARYSLTMELLEHHPNVRSGLDYLNQVTHIGDGTLVLLDSQGDMAVYECGHTKRGIIRGQGGFVVSTNHFVSDELNKHWMDYNPPKLRGNSEARYARISKVLQASSGQIDVQFAIDLMASHGNRLESICRHQDFSPRSTTISSVIYLPQQNLIYLANGLPCRERFHSWPAIR